MPAAPASTAESAELERLRSALLQAQAALQKADTERDRLERARRAAENQLATETAARKNAEIELARALSSLQRQALELERRAVEARALEGRLSELEGRALELGVLQNRYAELERRASEATSVPNLSEASAASSSTKHDDLRTIRGIGPAFARALQARGVITVAQIAAWTEADISEIAKALRIQPARIRENWVPSAHALLAGSSPPE